MNPALAALLGGFMQNTPSQTDPTAPAPQEEAEIVADSGPKSKYRQGLLHGFFGVGRTGGNILGILGDALSGSNTYSDRLQQAREAETLKGYDSEPEDAIARLVQISPDKGMAYRHQLHQTNRQSLLDKSLIRDRQDDYETNTHNRASSLIGAANAKTYPALRQKYYDYYRLRGIDPLVDLPETYDEAANMSLAESSVPVDKQIGLRDMRQYRDSVIAARREAEQGRDKRAAASNATRLSAAKLAASVRASEGQKNRDLRASEGSANRDLRRDLSKRGRQRPNIKWVRGPDGSIRPAQ